MLPQCIVAVAFKSVYLAEGFRRPSLGFIFKGIWSMIVKEHNHHLKPVLYLKEVFVIKRTERLSVF